MAVEAVVACGLRFRPGFYYGWVIVAVAVLFQGVALGSTLFSFPIWALQWIDEYHCSRAAAMLSMTLLLAAGGMMAPLIGAAIDRWSARGVICTGIILVVFGLGLNAVARQLWAIQLIWAVVLAAGTMMTGPLVAQALVSRWFNGRRGLAVGITLAGVGLGGTVMPPIVNMLVLAHGWRSAQLMIAALNLAVLLPTAWLFIRNSPQAAGVEPDPASELSARRDGDKGSEWTSREIFRSRAYWLALIAFIPLLTVAIALQHNLGEIGRDAALSPTEIGYLVAIFSAALAAGKLSFGIASDRMRVEPLYALAAVLFLFAIYILSSAGEFALLAVGGAALGFAFGSYFPVLGALLVLHYGARSIGTALGLVSLFGIATSLGPVAISAVRDTTGSYAAGYMLVAGLVVVAGLAFILLQTVAISARRTPLNGPEQGIA